MINLLARPERKLPADHPREWTLVSHDRANPASGGGANTRRVPEKRPNYEIKMHRIARREGFEIGYRKGQQDVDKAWLLAMGFFAGVSLTVLCVMALSSLLAAI